MAREQGGIRPSEAFPGKRSDAHIKEERSILKETAFRIWPLRMYVYVWNWTAPGCEGGLKIKLVVLQNTACLHKHCCSQL